MNFHIYVLIATIIFYVIFSFYKYQVQNESKKRSILIYVLLIPCLLYLTKFIFNIQNNDFSSIQNEYTNITDIKFNLKKINEKINNKIIKLKQNNNNIV